MQIKSLVGQTSESQVASSDSKLSALTLSEGEASAFGALLADQLGSPASPSNDDLSPLLTDADDLSQPAEPHDSALSYQAVSTPVSDGQADDNSLTTASTTPAPSVSVFEQGFPVSFHSQSERFQPEGEDIQKTATQPILQTLEVPITQTAALRPSAKQGKIDDDAVDQVRESSQLVITPLYVLSSSKTDSAFTIEIPPIRSQKVKTMQVKSLGGQRSEAPPSRLAQSHPNPLTEMSFEATLLRQVNAQLPQPLGDRATTKISDRFAAYLDRLASNNQSGTVTILPFGVLLPGFPVKSLLAETLHVVAIEVKLAGPFSRHIIEFLPDSAPTPSRTVQEPLSDQTIALNIALQPDELIDHSQMSVLVGKTFEEIAKALENPHRFASHSRSTQNTPAPASEAQLPVVIQEGVGSDFTSTETAPINNDLKQDAQAPVAKTHATPAVPATDSIKVAEGEEPLAKAPATPAVPASASIKNQTVVTQPDAELEQPEAQQPETLPTQAPVAKTHATPAVPATASVKVAEGEEPLAKAPATPAVPASASIKNQTVVTQPDAELEQPEAQQPETLPTQAPVAKTHATPAVPATASVKVAEGEEPLAKAPATPAIPASASVKTKTIVTQPDAEFEQPEGQQPETLPTQAPVAKTHATPAVPATASVKVAEGEEPLAKAPATPAVPASASIKNQTVVTQPDAELEQPGAQQPETLPTQAPVAKTHATPAVPATASVKLPEGEEPLVKAPATPAIPASAAIKNQAAVTEPDAELEQPEAQQPETLPTQAPVAKTHATPAVPATASVKVAEGKEPLAKAPATPAIPASASIKNQTVVTQPDAELEQPGAQQPETLPTQSPVAKTHATPAVPATASVKVAEGEEPLAKAPATPAVPASAAIKNQTVVTQPDAELEQPGAQQPETLPTQAPVAKTHATPAVPATASVKVPEGEEPLAKAPATPAIPASASVKTKTIVTQPDAELEQPEIQPTQQPDVQPTQAPVAKTHATPAVPATASVKLPEGEEPLAKAPATPAIPASASIRNQAAVTEPDAELEQPEIQPTQHPDVQLAQAPVAKTHANPAVPATASVKVPEAEEPLAKAPAAPAVPASVSIKNQTVITQPDAELEQPEGHQPDVQPTQVPVAKTHATPAVPANASVKLPDGEEPLAKAPATPAIPASNAIKNQTVVTQPDAELEQPGAQQPETLPTQAPVAKTHATPAVPATASVKVAEGEEPLAKAPATPAIPASAAIKNQTVVTQPDAEFEQPEGQQPETLPTQAPVAKTHATPAVPATASVKVPEGEEPLAKAPATPAIPASASVKTKTIVTQPDAELEQPEIQPTQQPDVQPTQAPVAKTHATPAVPATASVKVPEGEEPLAKTLATLAVPASASGQQDATIEQSNRSPKAMDDSEKSAQLSFTGLITQPNLPLQESGTGEEEDFEGENDSVGDGHTANTQVSDRLSRPIQSTIPGPQPSLQHPGFTPVPQGQPEQQAQSTSTPVEAFEEPAFAAVGDEATDLPPAPLKQETGGRPGEKLVAEAPIPAVSSQAFIQAVNQGVPMHFATVPSLIGDISATVAAQETPEPGKVDILLNPAHLGPIRLSFSLSADRAFNMTIETMTNASQKILETYFVGIRQAIAGNGLQIGELSAKVNTNLAQDHAHSTKNSRQANFNAGQRQSQHNRNNRRRGGSESDNVAI